MQIKVARNARGPAVLSGREHPDSRYEDHARIRVEHDNAFRLVTIKVVCVRCPILLQSLEKVRLQGGKILGRRTLDKQGPRLRMHQVIGGERTDLRKTWGMQSPDKLKNLRCAII